MAKAKKHKAIKPKRRCCKSKPRCKRCPVVLKRLAQRGFADRVDDGRYVLAGDVKKRDIKDARR